ncbi:2Fe-2S iron-sulfur cluster-binding protein [Nocardia farcinica]|uniref:Rhodocoxin n=2 Tax=Nocardia farcinica TaxID=37329 RepID=A0A0H5NFW8_NOCFR|nr:2Fe-2S iron-sulfur cluster-binding protein [Nocardia farcinica]SLH66218.1 ferredoxin [Mycobacteroides abscessus subsp. abscessus]AXK89208.1 ferredoxin [Nocardia farcinica]MBF6188998.1 2Fe-2S iron-sulfur cluster binding domain-containing protein [Nocardia farcinica]MBF6309409.1 2Fe-2S iron-sulfur cluster binding domain-containing protein [Nocardia farcinica]MBF6387725.1 2Fe-2S iron-sulfur cluster binding domain-containing protein [Nocardia farcinica]
MPKVFYTQPDGEVKVVDGAAGDSVMATAVKNGVTGIVGQCGGTLSCATCHVYVDPAEIDRFAEPSEDEDDMLECTSSDRADTSRLSCQLILAEGADDLHVTVPETQA